MPIQSLDCQLSQASRYSHSTYVESTHIYEPVTILLCLQLLAEVGFKHLKYGEVYKKEPSGVGSRGRALKTGAST